MNNYNNNNYSRSPGADTTKRFNKRPRYAGNTNSGGNNSPRCKYQNQSGYQYSPNRSAASDSFQHNQYEKNSNRYFYNTPKRSNYSQQQSNKQSPSYSHKSISGIDTTFSPSTHKINLPSQNDKLQAKAASATVTNQNNQLQQPFTPNNAEHTNYYGLPYNFYPSTYNADIISTASNSAFGVDGMSPYLWQTITSTPPPKLPHQQPPLPLQQPPALPPLPSPERPHLPPPPPMPSPLADSISTETTTDYLNQNISTYQDSGRKTIVKMKAKRKAMSMRYKLSKSWSTKDALLALKAEETNAKRLQKDFILVIRFPDPEISREIVKNYSPDIESVHFQLNFAPRYCLIHLKPGTNVEKTIEHLSKIPFGTGYLSVDIKQIPHKTHSTKLNEIDPFTLYVGNLPTTIACKTLKEHFPGAARIDIGFAQRMKYTRYAFIRYVNVHLAIEAYKRMLDAEIGGRTLTIRFRRLPAASEGNKDKDADAEAEADAENNDDVPDDASSLKIIDDLGQAEGDDVEALTSAIETHQTADDGDDDDGNSINDVEKNKSSDQPPQQESIPMEDNLPKTNESTASPLMINSRGRNEIMPEKNSDASLLNIKPDPDVDPNDVVIRHNTKNKSRGEKNDSSIKQEQESVALYEEFFERPQNPNHTSENSNRSTRNSLTSSTDDTDTISQLSGNSLGEFLQSCQRSSKQINSNTKDAEPAMKRNKATIKREPLEMDNIANKKNSTISSKDTISSSTACVKQESETSIENLNTSTETNRSINSNTVPVSRKRAANTNTSEEPPYTTTHNDDIVPPTAVFFTSDYHNKWTNSRNNCDNEDFYDEFYETRVSSQPSTSQTKFKTEPLDFLINRSTNDSNKKSQQAKSQNRNTSVGNNNICMDKSNRDLTTTMPNADDDDSADLVPAHNLLGSYRPHRNVVKQEMEHDDLFAVPFDKNSESNTDLTEGSQINSLSPMTECANITDTSQSHAAESIDEDVIVVSANIPPASKQKKSDHSLYNNLITTRLTDLVSFNYKPIAVSIPNREVSSLLIRDHLDELYDQLDADSDSEL